MQAQGQYNNGGQGGNGGAGRGRGRGQRPPQTTFNSFNQEETKTETPEQDNQQVEVGQKHKELADQKLEGVELLENKFTKNLTSPFINQKKSWDDNETFPIPEDIQKGIIEELGFIKPSNIQAVAIPMIAKPTNNTYYDLIAQSKNGSGKTGAFAIGSVLRVDPKIQKPQVLCVCHVRELSTQIAEVYKKITKFSDIEVSNYTTDGKADGCQVVVTTLGKLINALKGRRKALDLSELKAFVIDESDVFFNEERNLDNLKEVNTKYISKLPNKVQFIFFSATYTEDVKAAIAQFSEESNQINLRKEQLQLNHIQQFEYRCAPKAKPEFIKQIFTVCEMTQTVIFVNTRNYANALYQMMRKENYKATIIFGDMSVEERDEMIQKFRTGEVSVIITTNMLARGIDVPEVQIVINFDVPTVTEKEVRRGDSDNYMHRIGRTGRFGTKGIAITIYDRDEDKVYLDQILDYFSMHAKMSKLEAPEQLKGILEEIRAENI